MRIVDTDAERYIEHCKKNELSPSTIKAYRLDILHFWKFIDVATDLKSFIVNDGVISSYVKSISEKFAPRTAKRKSASISAFFEYLCFEGVLNDNPMKNIKTSFGIKAEAPKTLPIDIIEKLFKTAWNEFKSSHTNYSKVVALRNVSIMELIFTTGFRVSELCNLKYFDVILDAGEITVNGKGKRGRTVIIDNDNVLNTLRLYISHNKIESEYFFYNRHNNSRFSEQSVRDVIERLAKKSGIPFRISPNTIRHTFIDLLLNENFNIENAENVLGHSSLYSTYISPKIKSETRNRIPSHINPRRKINYD